MCECALVIFPAHCGEYSSESRAEENWVVNAACASLYISFPTSCPPLFFFAQSKLSCNIVFTRGLIYFLRRRKLIANGIRTKKDIKSWPFILGKRNRTDVGGAVPRKLEIAAGERGASYKRYHTHLDGNICPSSKLFFLSLAFPLRQLDVMKSNGGLLPASLCCMQLGRGEWYFFCRPREPRHTETTLIFIPNTFTRRMWNIA